MIHKFSCVYLESDSAFCHVFWGLHRQQLCLKRQSFEFLFSLAHSGARIPNLWQNPLFVTSQPPPTVAHGDVTNEELWSWQGKQMNLEETKIFFACSCPWSWGDGGGKWGTELQLTLRWPKGQNHLHTEHCEGSRVWLLTFDCFTSPQLFVYWRGENQHHWRGGNQHHDSTLHHTWTLV